MSLTDKEALREMYCTSSFHCTLKTENSNLSKPKEMFTLLKDQSNLSNFAQNFNLKSGKFEQWVIKVLINYNLVKKSYKGLNEVEIKILLLLKERLKGRSLHKKWNFPWKISSVNMTKSAGNCEFRYIYWRNP